MGHQAEELAAGQLRLAEMASEAAALHQRLADECNAHGAAEERAEQLEGQLVEACKAAEAAAAAQVGWIGCYVLGMWVVCVWGGGGRWHGREQACRLQGRWAQHVSAFQRARHLLCLPRNRPYLLLCSEACRCYRAVRRR